MQISYCFQAVFVLHYLRLRMRSRTRAWGQ